jgi:hypothetical protein
MPRPTPTEPKEKHRISLGPGNEPIAKHDGIGRPAPIAPRPLTQPGDHRRALRVIHALEQGCHLGNPARPLPHTSLQYETFALTRDEHQAHQLSKQQSNNGGRHQSPKQRLRPKGPAYLQLIDT